MKSAPFDYFRPKTVAEASVALGRRGANTAAIAGGQSLMPMLSLRVALIDLLVDISRLDDLKIVAETPDSLWLGALTTHAAIEDGKVPDIFSGLMRRVAGQISYRAVRNHGTIGGSVALADPAADWPTCLMALGTSLRVVGRNGVRVQSIDDFLKGAYETTLATGESTNAPASTKLAAKVAWPKTLAEQVQAIRSALAAPIDAATLSKTFKGARADRVEEILETLASLGQARALSGGRYVAA